MKRLTSRLSVALLIMLACASAHARKDDVDVMRLDGSLNQLSSDPQLGAYAQAEQSLARDAINQLAQASSREHPHALYIAERRVDQAKAAAQLQASQLQLTQADQENAQLQLDRSRIDADAARQELDFQRAQNQIAQQQSARLQQQGQEAADQAAQARAEADQARKLAAAQSKVAAAAKRQADLAGKAAKALRSQMDQPSTSGGN